MAHDLYTNTAIAPHSLIRTELCGEEISSSQSCTKGASCIAARHTPNLHTYKFIPHAGGNCALTAPEIGKTRTVTDTSPMSTPEKFAKQSVPPTLAAVDANFAKPSDH
jgi:hypothetical protein